MNELIQRRIDLGDIHLHIHTMGSGPVVVLCHGFPGHWTNWRAQMSALAEAGYCAVAPDMRGYGQSSRPDEIADYDMNAQLADMCGLLDALGTEKAIFIGQDFGASMVWSMAQRLSLIHI